MTRRRWLPFALLSLLIGALAALFIGGGLRATGLPTPILPLDDAYIHFQYARALAEGYPFRYNPDQPPTSGATSLLYPFVLALGYRLGFIGEALAWWALGVGVLTWLGAAWLLFRLIEAESGGATTLALGVAAIFVLHGSLAWAFLSGMETGLFLWAIFLTLWHVRAQNARAALTAAALTALIRPEGAVIALTAALYVLLTARRVHGLYYALPLAACVVQPLLNLALTGSPSGSGMQAKSYLYNVPPDPQQTLRLIGETFGRLWGELFTDVGIYNTAFFAVLALIPLAFGAWQLIGRRKVSLPILIAAWLLGLSAITALVETAFWQFKRYQQPIIALLVLLSSCTLGALSSRGRGAAHALLGACALYTALGVGGWSAHYHENVREVAFSQRVLAQAVADLPPESLVGAHDIGAVRYLGGRTTYDVVGLTTPAAAEAWRHGAGAVFEQLYASPWRPDHFAIYPDARGLTYFVQSGVFGEVLGSFPSTQPRVNVASATASGQFLYRADWTYAVYAAQPMQPSTLAEIAGFDLVDSLNVAHLASERAHNYLWWQALRRDGFPSELHALTYQACAPPDEHNSACRVADGGRLLTGGEEFTIRAEAGRDLLWIMRVQAQYPIRLRLYADGQLIGERIVPEIAGKWVEIASLVPSERIAGDSLKLRVEVAGADEGGFYLPYYHWFYQGVYRRERSQGEAVATFADSVALNAAEMLYDSAARTLTLDLTWSLIGEAPFDAVVFMHIYDESGALIEAAQRDVRVGGGALPPANWLPERLYRERHALQLPAALPAGTYRAAVGLYDPCTLRRYAARGASADGDQRVFIGLFRVGEE